VETPRVLAGEPQPSVAVRDTRVSFVFERRDHLVRIEAGFEIDFVSVSDDEIASVDALLDVDVGSAECRFDVVSGVDVEEVDTAVARLQALDEEGCGGSQLGFLRPVEQREMTWQIVRPEFCSEVCGSRLACRLRNGLRLGSFHNYLFIETRHKTALSSLAPPQLVSFRRAIDAVSDGCSNARIVQTIHVRSTDCPPTNYGNGRCAF